MDTRKYRHELKFLCDEKELFHIESKIRHICRLDKHTGDASDYSIKSLYFDTLTDRCYSENMAGADCRKKYRIRIYNNQTETIHLECKYSCHSLKAKDICSITRTQCENLMKGLSLWESLGETDSREDPGGRELLRRFLAERDMEILSPKVIVEYVRTPYVFPVGNVRITFDRIIRSSREISSFLGRTSALQSILPQGMHILEVKYDQMLPGAILELVSGGQDLQRTSFSKYALCRQCNIY